MHVCYIVILDLRCNIYDMRFIFLILHHVLCVLAIDPGTSTECTETPVCEEPGRYIPSPRRPSSPLLPSLTSLSLSSVQATGEPSRPELAPLRTTTTVGDPSHRIWLLR